MTSGDLEEALVVLESDHSPEAMGGMSPRVTITQRLPPRLIVVSGPRRAIQALRAQPGVLAVTDGEAPAEVLDDLSGTERLFAAAWAVRRRPKDRPGDGLDWDAPGFQAPDPPPSPG